MNIPELCTLRHRTSSGQVDAWWEFLPAVEDRQNRVLASIRLGNAPAVEVEIPVCSNHLLLPGHWIVVRRGESVWTLTAALLPVDFSRIVKSKQFHPDLPVGSLSLIDSPEDVSEEMSSI